MNCSLLFMVISKVGVCAACNTGLFGAVNPHTSTQQCVHPGNRF